MNIKPLENKLVELNKGLPKLPKQAVDVLTKYLWIIAIISAVFGILGIVTILGIGTFGASMIADLGYAGSAASLWSNILFGVVGMAAVAVIELMSVGPLKKQSYKGWKLAFYAVMLSFIFSLLGDILSNKLDGLIGTLLSAAIGTYILMQVRNNFIDKKTKKEDTDTNKKENKKPEKTKEEKE
ncbi:hypothetical protein GX865_01690 [Candidatus Saccharibacteria bacterium]|jgi:uncharacterized membrane protein YuzA (DUF378 family)|nr:hypothetical protein [Candidatus Saccharibacteria bacterium]